MTMISALSAHIVEDLGKDNLSPVDGISLFHNIKPLTVIIERTTGMWPFFTSKQYKALDLHFSDVLAENSECPDALKSPELVSSAKVVSCYSKVLNLPLGANLSVQIYKEYPDLKATAKKSGGMSMSIETGGLMLKTIKQDEFEKAMKQRTLNADHTFVKSFLSERRRKLCVINSVLVTEDKTKIVFTSKCDGHADVSAKVAGHGGYVSADIDSSQVKEVILEAGIVLACRWQRMKTDETLCISPDMLDTENINNINVPLKNSCPDVYCERYNSSDEFDLQVSSNFKEELNPSTENVRISDADANISNENNISSAGKKTKSDDETDESSEEENTSDDKERRDDDWRLHDLYDSTEKQEKRFKAAVATVMHSSGDMESLLDLFENESGVKEEEFTKKLHNTGEVLSLVKLMGYTIRENIIRQRSKGPFAVLAPAVVEAMTLFDVEDLERIRKCDSDQKKNILCIIKAASDHKKSITIDSKFLQDVQNEPVENIIALLDVNIDFQTGKVELPSTYSIRNARAHSPLKYLLYSL